MTALSVAEPPNGQVHGHSHSHSLSHSHSHSEHDYDALQDHFHTRSNSVSSSAGGPLLNGISTPSRAGAGRLKHHASNGSLFSHSPANSFSLPLYNVPGHQANGSIDGGSPLGSLSARERRLNGTPPSLDSIGWGSTATAGNLALAVPSPIEELATPRVSAFGHVYHDSHSHPHVHGAESGPDGRGHKHCPSRQDTGDSAYSGYSYLSKDDQVATGGYQAPSTEVLVEDERSHGANAYNAKTGKGERSRFTKALIPYAAGYPLLHQVLVDKDSRRIFYFMSLNFAFMAVQAFYGYVTDSLGLLSDSIHMFFDCVALAVGLFASIASRWPPSDRFPYGTGKIETLSGFANGIFLM